MGFIEGAVHGMSAAFILFTQILCALERRETAGLSAFTGAA
jgi:energy-converting hydrogenase Eha subunit G